MRVMETIFDLAMGGLVRLHTILDSSLNMRTSFRPTLILLYVLTRDESMSKAAMSFADRGRMDLLLMIGRWAPKKPSCRFDLPTYINTSPSSNADRSSFSLNIFSVSLCAVHSIQSFFATFVAISKPVRASRSTVVGSSNSLPVICSQTDSAMMGSETLMDSISSLIFGLSSSSASLTLVRRFLGRALVLVDTRLASSKIDAAAPIIVSYDDGGDDNVSESIIFSKPSSSCRFWR
mmetsp:Transcript_74758/g.112690  ORF Transcript_74758/g.112690 Transcript_74758/m.112690 type:complete len:235 (-) Transcript_74758:208-912(-)